MKHRKFAALLLAAVLLSGTPASRAVAPVMPDKPNIVFILTDDFSDNLLTPQLMPDLWSLSQQGTSFEDYFVTDSLCCPSRASIFTGDFPHDTGVFSNSGSDGGYSAFERHGDEKSTLATDLHAQGYRTAMMGKYLNRYKVSDPPAPGWDQWDVADWGYPEFNYYLNEDGKKVYYGGPHQRKDNYLTDVLSGLAASFIKESTARYASQPFFLEVATFAPHAPYTPAPKYSRLYPGLQYPMSPAFDAANTNAPSWLGHRGPLSASQLSAINEDFRLRAEDVKSIDDLIGNVVSALKATGRFADTYIVFSSDNGLHMGEHRLMPGKLTAFDTDIKVPLVIVGPGIRQGGQVAAFSQNVDLRPTFDAMAGTVPAVAVDGMSLLPLMSTSTIAAGIPKGWPQGALIEHHGPVTDAGDPDRQDFLSADPPNYEALRLPGALYVEYADGEREYYDLTTDPNELDNVYSSLPAGRKDGLHKELLAAEDCHGAKQCAAAFTSPG